MLQHNARRSLSWSRESLARGWRGLYTHSTAALAVCVTALLNRTWLCAWFRGKCGSGGMSGGVSVTCPLAAIACELFSIKWVGAVR
ncbi:hypothetical protein HDK90DRAFT_5649 [Phyllosticta capitalensis]|uniref:Uncharacterized protein n=1 Tax=Phyllosticta capitalensis TaxID=121624 RepID=A0ABR1Z1G3_9PEZI